MPRNIEIKATVAAPGELELLVAALADRGPEILVQDDTFFQVADGRLKLREFADGRGELIFYRRVNDSGPSCSHYEIVPTDSPGKLRDLLSSAYGTVGRVRKVRRLYLAGPVRIHLDDVEQLGNFLELEVVLERDQSEAEGIAIAEKLMRKLQVRPEDLVPVAYLDLLKAKQADGFSRLNAAANA